MPVAYDHIDSAGCGKEALASWEIRVKQATRDEEVLAAVREYIAAFPLESAEFPEAVQPPARFVDPEEVGFYAFQLAREKRRAPQWSPELDMLAGFMTTASGRLIELIAKV